MRIIDNIEDLRRIREALGRVGLVPTMGALHDGHLELVKMARQDNPYVIVSIFVNPTQFGPDEDLDAYPRDLEGDAEKLSSVGAGFVFTPTPALMYPAGYQTYVTVEGMTRDLEGDHRPGHFRGVATVVAKLFNLVQPHRAYFGQKDAQQVAVIRQLVRDLNFPVEIGICPTQREPDGLAMSSRNAYLTAEQRQAAPVLKQALDAVGAAYSDGERRISQLEGILRGTLAAEPLAQPEYASIVAARTLKPITNDDAGQKPLLASMAVRIGKARLLDNCLLPLELNTRTGLESTLGAIRGNS